MRINHNISALNAYNQLSKNNAASGKNLQKLASGLRINSAADDAAGLSISEKMRAQIRGLDAAVNNAQNGISMVQTAEGALTETHSILQRVRELVVQAGNQTNAPEDLTAIKAETDALVLELDRIGDTTEFNGIKLLDGAHTFDFVVGTKGTAAELITMTTASMKAADLGDGTTQVNAIDVTDFATTAVDVQLAGIDGAIADVSVQRSNLGATQNRLEHTINSLSGSAENLTAADSRIRDVDMAREMVNFTKNNILMQSAQSMMAQANSQPQSVLQLLRG